MKNSLKYILSIVALLLVSLTSNEANANGRFVTSSYDYHFMACSNMASQKSSGHSDALYLGYFYGCMMSLGHDTSML